MCARTLVHTAALALAWGQVPDGPLAAAQDPADASVPIGMRTMSNLLLDYLRARQPGR
jgi:hypothetical protein